MRVAARVVLSALVLPLALALAAPGCGGSDEEDQRERVGRAVTESVLAAHAGDLAKACSLYTHSYVRETLRENRGLRVTGGEGCAGLVRAMRRVLQRLTPDPKPRVSDVTVSGDEARALLQIDTALGPAASEIFLVRQGGDWKVDHDRDLQGEPQPPGG